MLTAGNNDAGQSLGYLPVLRWLIEHTDSAYSKGEASEGREGVKLRAWG